jgi:hypothetical protein
MTQAASVGAPVVSVAYVAWGIMSGVFVSFVTGVGVCRLARQGRGLLLGVYAFSELVAVRPW